MQWVATRTSVRRWTAFCTGSVPPATTSRMNREVRRSSWRTKPASLERICLPTARTTGVCTHARLLLRDADMHSAYLLRRRGWLGGWLSVTRRYCIKTAKTILKLFRPPGSPIILVSSDPCTDTQFQGETL